MPRVFLIGIIGIIFGTLIQLGGITGCQETSQGIDSLKIKPAKTVYTVKEFLSEFPALSLPVEVFDEEWYNNKVKTIGIAYFDTFIVHPNGIFPESKGEETAFGFYGKIADEKRFLPLIIVQEKKDGSYFYFVTLQPDTSRLKVIDKEIIAFRKISEEHLDIQKAIINLNWQIVAKREYTHITAPKSVEEAADMGNVKIEKREEKHSWKVNSDGTIEPMD